MDLQKSELFWAHLHGLLALDEQGSFTAAAAKIGISRAAMSQRIADLEKALGLMLVRRTTRSVQLTESGRRLVDEIREPFGQIAQSYLGVRDAKGEPRGLVRVTVPVALGRQQIVRRVADFLRGHPKIRVEMQMSDRLSSLAAEGFDLAIRHAEAAPDTHVAWTLCRTESVLIASPDYLSRRGSPARPEDLVGHDCLHYPREQAPGQWAFEPREGASRRSRRVSITVGGCFAASNSEALRIAAEDGLGIALVPDFTAQSALAAGLVATVLPSWRPVGAFAEKILAIRPYSHHVPLAVSLLVEHLRDSMGDGFLASGHVAGPH